MLLKLRKLWLCHIFILINVQISDPRHFFEGIYISFDSNLYNLEICAIIYNHVSIWKKSWSRNLNKFLIKYFEI